MENKADISKKVIYLKGLFDGYDLDESKGETKMIKEILGVLEEIADAVDTMADSVDELSDYVEEVDQSLADVEEFLVGGVEGSEGHTHEHGEGCSCGCDHDHHDHEHSHEHGEGEAIYEITCPNCNDLIYLDEEMISDGEILCPTCGTLLEFDFDDDDATQEAEGIQSNE